MYHAKTDEHNKSVILSSLATMALGMGVNFAGLTCIVHYGAPKSLEDYFQESGRAGRTGEQSTSTVYWSRCDVPGRRDKRDRHNVELDIVRAYLNTTGCRRKFLLDYFDPRVALSLLSGVDKQCCDNCCEKLCVQT